jgi:hypothetical protein
MAISEARRRANQKWREAHKDYFAAYYRNRYQNDPAYREQHIAYRKERRDIKREASRIMSIEI